MACAARCGPAISTASRPWCPNCCCNACPTIGIGASAACDGQILVTEDIVGLFSDFTPKFVKRYAELGTLISEAAQAYAEDVRARRFPGAEHVFAPKPSGNTPNA